MSDQKSKITQIEENILNNWKELNIFEKTLKKDSPKGEFVFYDGPPFANGLPHYGHLLASYIKDTIPRYKTMKGFNVPRRWGWDCHGLPVENLIEKELGLKTKKDIETYGIEKFNNSSKESVLRYTDEWKNIINRIGRFVDMKNDYRTMDSSYTQSVWWVFKELFDKGLVYEGFKSMHLCPRCETTLSNFEVNQGYKDITDISVFIKFLLKDEDDIIKNSFGVDNKGKVFFLAWTTTPWTLPGNTALAVGENIDYAIVLHDNNNYILARDKVSDLFSGKEFNLFKVIKGKDLVGNGYIPLFSYYDNELLNNRKNGFKIYSADFVNTEDGSGIVHIAPAFGDDDLKLSQKHNLPFIQHVSADGKFKPEVIDFAGLEVKPKDNHQSTDIEIIKYLAKNNFLFEKKKIIHSYPHCWRCNTPLLNYATSSWFIKVTDIKNKLISENQKVNWIPKDIKNGRFGKWLESVRDWAVSRSRFWGAPLPIWRGIDSKKIFVIGSIDQLKKIVKKSNNKYFLLRHGESSSNISGISDSYNLNQSHLTEQGRKEAFSAAIKLKSKNIDIIVSSDFSRTKETAHIVADIIGIDKNKIVYDERIREYKVGKDNEGKLWTEIEAHTKKNGLHPQMETEKDLRKRVFSFMYDLDEKYSGKNVLIVSHGAILNTITNGIEEDLTLEKVFRSNRKLFRKTGELHTVDFVKLPHNHDYELDLHRPFIDKVEYEFNRETLMRVPEVFDCWFESGSMPYGKASYIGKETKDFSPKKNIFSIFKKEKGFPAHFIAEGQDQTRGWFYTMMVLGTALFGRSPYQNVIVNGIILAEDGEKMSKSLKNYPDPMDIVNKYGSDSLRYYLLSSPVVSAQDLRFSEKGVDEVSKKLIQRLDNSFVLYELYSDQNIKPSFNSNNILDKWIIARLKETSIETDKWLNLYQLDKASRPLMNFIEDLSTWYLRRSRERFKSENKEEKNEALSTAKYVFSELSKLSAPFIPFYSDYLYGKVCGVKESVHLEDWSEFNLSSDELNLIKDMEKTRNIVTLALDERTKANIKVRQPLASLSIRDSGLSKDFISLIKDEVNVKEVIVNENILKETSLNTIITADLKREGIARDLIRAIQDLRKKEGLTVSDRVILLVDSDQKGKELISEFIKEIKKITLIIDTKNINLPDAEELVFEDFKFKINFSKEN